MIWKDGYASGEYRSHIYAEVPARLRAWKDAGKQLYVYSSGSVTAQKLLFAHTEAGDLTPLFDGYFDTETGGKREAGSYRCIAAAIGVAPEQILFPLRYRRRARRGAQRRIADDPARARALGMPDSGHASVRRRFRRDRGRLRVARYRAAIHRARHPGAVRKRYPPRCWCSSCACKDHPASRRLAMRGAVPGPSGEQP